MSTLMPQANHFVFYNGAVGAARTFFSDPVHLGRIPNQATFLAVQANLFRDAGGTTIDCYVQTSLDDGATWIDIMNLTFGAATERIVAGTCSTITLGTAALTPSDGTLADDTIVQGLIGDLLRLRMTVVGAYGAGSTMRVDAVVR